MNKVHTQWNNGSVSFISCCDSMDAFDYNIRPVVMLHGLSYENIEHKSKCSHCGQWGKVRNECSYCGAPIDE